VLSEASRGGAEAFTEALAGVSPLATLLLWLGPVNVVLGVFNLVPGCPLDGGRVLRSVLWGASGDLTKATRWAAGVGQLFAWALIAFGFVQLFRGGFVQGLWTILIGWFLNNAARQSVQELLVRQSLQGVPVTQVMFTALERVSPELPLESFVRDHLMRSEQLAFPVETDGRLLGLVCFADVRKVPQSRWTEMTVGEVMTPAGSLSTLPANAGAEQALEELARRDVDQLPVVDGDHVLGLVRRRDLVRWMALQAGGPRGFTPSHA
jgi:CBS domain-containing protein